MLTEAGGRSLEFSDYTKSKEILPQASFSEPINFRGDSSLQHLLDYSRAFSKLLQFILRKHSVLVTNEPLIDLFLLSKVNSRVSSMFLFSFLIIVS